MRRLIYQLLRLFVMIALMAGGLFYAHTHWMKYERFICDPYHLPEGQICLKTILETMKGKVLWVDARSQDAFERSMYLDENGKPKLGDTYIVPIRNDAQGMDLLNEAMPALLQASSQRTPIVVFCDKSCSSATEVANQLRDPSLGLETEVFVLAGGWDVLRREPRYQEKAPTP